MRRTLRERFEEKFCPEALSGCWLWDGAADPVSWRGHIYVDGVVRPAPRVAFELYVGPIPDGLLVRHRCDVPACVNPDHLVLGTDAENTRDMVSRGRARHGRSEPLRGSANGASKLTEAEVTEMHRLHAAGTTYRDLGRRFGVSTSGAHLALTKRWRHVAAALALALVGLAGSASSQREDRFCPEAARPVLLTRLTFHEAGVDALVDAAAIYAAIDGLSRLRDESWEESACSYSGRALRGETRRRWISLLDGSGLAPPGFPHDRASWSVQWRLVARLLDHSVAVVAGAVGPACDIDPTDWGDPEHDGERIQRGIARGYWYRVDCGDARNVYLRRAAADREGR